MSKFTGFIVGGLEILAGVVALFVPGGAAVAPYLFALGVSSILKNTGTLITGAVDGSGSGPSALQGGISVASRNPVAPHLVVYGRTVVGGTIVYINEFGDDNKFLDMVLVLACHPCQSVDSLLFDKQIVQLGSNKLPWNGLVGDSFTPVPQDENIKHISRTNGVVTCLVQKDIPLLVPGDYIALDGITGDRTLNGRFTVAEVPSHLNSFGGVTFTYLSGGLNSIVDNEGQVHTQWPDYGRKIHMEVLLGHHSATFPGMLNGTPVDQDDGNIVNPANNPWTTHHLLLGLTSVFLRIHFNDVYFAQGLPTISFLLKGKTDIYDPRKGAVGVAGTTGYSENAALCTADFLANTRYRFSAAYGSEIPLPPLIAAANHCDEPVALAAGGSEPRYALNGKFELTTGRGAILRSMLTACGGRLSYQGGQFIIWPAVWTGTSGNSPGIDHMTGPFEWKGTSVRDLYNGVKGTYISQANSWQPGDLPPYAQDSTHGYSLGAPWNSATVYGAGVHVVYKQIGYVSITASTNYPPDQHPEAWAVAYQDINLAEDNGERRWLDVQLPFTISAATAQRLCKIELLRRRHFVTATLKYNMAGYAMTVMDVVQVTVPVINWNANTVEVLAHRFTMEKQNIDGADVPSLGTEIDVQETDASVYDWSQTEELTAQGYQQPVVNLVQPAPPTGLVLESDTSTTQVTAAGTLADTVLIRWTAPDDAYVSGGGHIEIRYMELQDYSAGTVSVTQGSPHVTGNGTAWTPAMNGSDITINGVTWEILTVDSPAAITLTAPYSPPSSPTQPYFISYGETWIGLPSVQPSVTQVNLVKVTDGLQYIVQIRSVNVGGFPSEWVEAGPITARGARVPLPLRPYSQAYLFTVHGYGFTLAQRQGDTTEGPHVEISGTRPVNVFSTVAAPVIDPYGVTSANASGNLPIGDGVAQVFGIDPAGLRTPGSGFMDYTILNSLSQVTFNLSVAPGTTGYELFLGPDAENLIGQGAVSGITTAISFHFLTSLGYGPPDDRAVKMLARGKRVSHGGIAGTTVYGQTLTTIVIGVPGTPAANEYAGRSLLIVSHMGLPESQSFSVIPILSSDAGSPLCTLQVPSPQGGQVVIGDVVTITTKATSATLTSITDSGFQNAFAPAGLTPGEETGNIVRVMYDPTNAAIPGDSVTVTGNSPTTISTTPFKRAPGAGTVFIVEEPSWLTGDIVTSILKNSVAPDNTPDAIPLATVPVSGLAGRVALIELLVQDAYGSNSPETPDGFRMLYVLPDSSMMAGGGGYFDIITVGGTANIDLANGFTQRVVIHPGTPLAIAKPSYTNGSLAQGLEFTLLVDEDTTGGAPVPAFATGSGGFAADVGGWQIDGTAHTRTTYFFQLINNLWGLKVSPPSTGGPVT